MSNPSRVPALVGLLLSLCVAPSVRAAHTDSQAQAAYGDPSGRVARLNHSQGEVSYSPAGEDEWVDAARNRPLVSGDRLWTDHGARAELQVGNAALRLGANTSLEILDLDDRVAQVRLTEGTLNLRVRRLYSGQSYEVATPTLAFTVTRAGRYRIDVDGRDDQTTVVVWEGAGEAYGEHSRFPLRAGDSVIFYGTDLRDHDLQGLPRADAFDRYCLARDRRLDRSVSRRYVDDDMVGYADLDEYGSWRPVSGYGTVWFPSHVDAGWAPYRDGHWVWQEPWGWTWVDHAAWGFAPSHYGRWVHVSSRWGWIPGPRNVRPVYAPALVAFVGGRGWSVSISLGQSAPVGWFPLAPREVYVPPYRASRDYFTRVNVNNTVVNNTTITNVYNNNYGNNNTNVTQVNYANRTVAGAVTAVPATVFVNAQPVQAAAIRVEGTAVTTGEITRVAPVAPGARSVLGASAPAAARPSRETQQRRVLARSAPPQQRSFAEREQQLQRAPAQVSEAPAVQAAPAAAVAPNVSVIAEPSAAVDARAAGSRRGNNKAAARADRPGRPERANPSKAPVSPPQAGSEPQVAAPRAETTGQEEQRQRRGRDEQQAAQAAEQQRAAAKGQEEQRQRKGRDEQQAAQAAEQQRAAAKGQDEQRQRKAESDQQARKDEQAERERGAERERQVAAQHQAEQQRLAEAQERQRQGKAESDQRQIAEAQRVERERLADKQEQERRELKAESDAQVTERQRAERQRQDEARKLALAECERQAVEKKQDKRQCRDEPASPQRRGKKNKDERVENDANPDATRRGR